MKKVSESYKNKVGVKKVGEKRMFYSRDAATNGFPATLTKRLSSAKNVKALTGTNQKTN